MTEHICKNCKWLGVKPDKLGRRLVRKEKSYPCEYIFPKIKVPASAHGFRQPTGNYLGWMEGLEGENCECWVKYEPESPIKIS